jgi:ASC-1-like (ASCH) protein
MTHELKTLPQYFEEVWKGNKTFEVRKNDRNFKVGDEVLLKEYLPFDDEYTGRKVLGMITYILQNFEALDGEYVVFAFKSYLRNQ